LRGKFGSVGGCHGKEGVESEYAICCNFVGHGCIPCLYERGWQGIVIIFDGKEMHEKYKSHGACGSKVFYFPGHAYSHLLVY